jgi:hypothetical protein
MGVALNSCHSVSESRRISKALGGETKRFGYGPWYRTRRAQTFRA